MLRFSVEAPLQPRYRAFVRPWHIPATRTWRSIMATALESIQAKMKKPRAQADVFGADTMTTGASIASKAELP